jgi:hypothetical protein
MEVPLNTKIRITIWPSNPASEHLPKDLKLKWRRGICLPTFTVALFTRFKLWIQYTYPQWLKKIWYIYTMKYYSTFKRRICVVCDTMEETRRQYAKWNKPTQKDKYCMFLLKYGTIKPIKAENKTVEARGVWKMRWWWSKDTKPQIDGK